jgi:sialic acid synthase SpsE
MPEIILDISANTHRNDWDYLKRMLDSIKEIDSGKHTIVIKHQLFKEAGENIPLNRTIFELAYVYAEKLGYKTTSSVFDKESLDFLLQFEVPFIKLANRPDLYWLAGEIPRKIPVYTSIGEIKARYGLGTGKDIAFLSGIFRLLCISKYPASIKDYKEAFNNTHNDEPNILDNLKKYKYGLSDHTTDFSLWNCYEPDVIEWHYVLEHDPNNLDGGPFARTPAMLKEIL